MELNHKDNIQNNLHFAIDPKRILSRLVRRLYVKKEEEKKLQESTDNEKIQLLKSIRDIHHEWEQANKDFEFAGDEASVDYYTYKIKACEVRYEHFLREAKDKGVQMQKSLQL